MLSGMITDRAAVQALDLMGRVTVEEVPVQDLMVIRADIMVKIVRTTRVVYPDEAVYFPVHWC